MKKLFTFILSLFLIASSINSYADYATGGTGKYIKQIYWLSWKWGNANVGLQSFKAQGSSTAITSGTLTIGNGEYIWKVTDLIRVRGMMTNKTNNTFVLRNLNAYNKSGLQYLYSGLNTSGIAIGNKDTETNEMGFDLELFVEIKRNGIWISIDPSQHGIVFADAESLSNTSEHIECLTNNNSNWYLIDAPDKDKDGKTLTDCNYKIKVIDTTVNNQEYKKVRLDNLSANGQYGNMAVMYAHGANKFINLRFKGQGMTDVALGYFLNQDIANAEGYEGAYHFQEILTSSTQASKLVNISGTKTLCQAKANFSIPDAKLTTTLYIGQKPNVDDRNDTVNNLDGITQINKLYDQHPGTISFKVKATNTLSDNGYLYVWLDKNNDKKFSADEYQTIILPPNTIDQEYLFTFNGLSLAEGDYVFRVRATSDQLFDDLSTADVDERSIRMASNGEVTDFTLQVLPISALPVKIADFNGKKVENTIVLNWNAFEESNIDNYEVQKMLKNDWKSIGFVAAKNNEANVSKYEFVDNEVQAQNQYRLKINENNDVTTYSNIVFINANDVNQTISIYPNPTANSITIEPINKLTTVEIYNAMGAKIGEQLIDNQNSKIDFSTYPSGIYYISINNEKYKVVKN